jgi:GH25 family lysozyme M1 (1,4-beta-N-acetylmuramidase)
LALVASVALAVTATVATAPASAAATVPDGGGWAHAGVVPGSSAAPRSAATVVPQSAPPGYSVLGIDVSSHDHSTYSIDWPGVAASGVQFAYVKASEGQFYTNPYFHADNTQAKAAGLLVGAYAFGRPDLRDPIGEANYFIDHAEWNNDSRTLVPFLDMEWPYSALNLPTCYGLSPSEMVSWIHAFADQVRTRIGRKIMIYTNPNWWNPCTGNDQSFGDHPLDLANYSGSPSPLPASWQNWTVWQYAPGNPSAAGNYDQDVFNGDYAALKRMAGVDPPPPLTSAPVVVQQGSGQVDVFANAGGALVERMWAASTGWSAWANFGGALTGKPSVLVNPRNGNVEVYANSNGHVVEKYWQAGNGAWSGWNDLGGSITGDPVAFYDPNNRNVEVYANSNGNLVERFWQASNGAWSGWNGFGGNLTGDPVVFYNPNNRNVEVYANSNGNLVELYWQASNGSWNGWNGFGGNLTTDPAVLYNSVNRNVEVYANSNGNLAELYWQASNGSWNGWINMMQ